METVVTGVVVVLFFGALYVVGWEIGRWVSGGPRRVPPGLAPLTEHLGPRLRASRLGRDVVEGLERVGLLERRRPPSEPVPSVLLALELRRLAAEVRRIEASDQPHPAARIAAALAAYDHVLVQLCSRADVPTPIGLLPLDPRDRVDLEAELVATGVDW
ncbi:hypothetical protein [Phycicoccus sonneratiae]|uniref:Uncharacterized protein n=1 Tax=Phycicoccus sonneratiae TaxID=2807628 RepID=A0ABS2CL74_9MICO|nr:hypothetical protein [Phycicoccus sonneraticus]MBM6400626.1 hypothetical protein [Phycicoccus sonneraticus]